MTIKKIIFIQLLLFICIPDVFCDTIGYYHVYYNNIILKNSSDKTGDTLPVVVKKADIKEKDSLTIKYWQDTPCENCKFFLVVIDERKKYVKVTSTIGQASPLSISLSEILKWSENYYNDNFEIYYYKEKPAFPIHLFKLILE